MPLYPLYALLFADTGLSEGEISALLAIWTAVAIVAEVPSGALADRFSRRSALALAGLLQAAGHALWIAAPGFPAFAAGFVLWGIGGSLSSGTFQALVYEGLTAAGAGDRYAAVMGRAEAAGQAVQVPVAGAATLLFEAGGYALAGAVSVGACLGAAALATRLPERRRSAAAGGEREPGYLATLRSGLGAVATSGPVRTAVMAVALLVGIDAIEEYFPLLAAGWGVPTAAVPLAMLAIPLAGAAGAALAGRGARLGGAGLTLTMLVALALMAAAGLLAQPAGLALVAIFYGLHRMVQVVADARLQERIEVSARATATSVATLGSEVVALALVGVWALGGLGLVVAGAAIAVLVLPRWLGRGAAAAPAAEPVSEPSSSGPG